MCTCACPSLFFLIRGSGPYPRPFGAPTQIRLCRLGIPMFSSKRRLPGRNGASMSTIAMVSMSTIAIATVWEPCFHQKDCFRMLFSSRTASWKSYFFVMKTTSPSLQNRIWVGAPKGRGYGAAPLLRKKKKKIPPNIIKKINSTTMYDTTIRNNTRNY